MTKVTKKTSFHHGGIWFHVEWNESGTRGVDQHGTVWYNIEHPTCSHPFIPAMCQTTHAVLTAKKEAV